jgi:anti-sigma B factor antagonist
MKKIQAAFPHIGTSVEGYCKSVNNMLIYIQPPTQRIDKMALTTEFENGTDPRTVRISLRGDLDTEGGDLARRAVSGLIAAGRVDITVNLDGVGFLDSSGLASLIASLRLARDQGGDVTVETTNDRIRRVLEVTALAQVFKLQPTTSAAA